MLWKRRGLVATRLVIRSWIDRAPLCKINYRPREMLQGLPRDDGFSVEVKQIAVVKGYMRVSPTRDRATPVAETSLACISVPHGSDATGFPLIMVIFACLWCQ